MNEKRPVEQSPPHSVTGRMGFFDALRFILPLPRSIEAPASGKAIARWFVPIGLVIGLIYVAVYRGSWRVFGEINGFRLLPGLTVWALDVALFGAVLYSAAGHWFSFSFLRKREELRRVIPLVLFLVVLLVIKLSLWLAIPEGVSRWPGIWGTSLNALYPHAIYRPLILAPLWGRWGVLLASGLGRPAEGACETTRALGLRRSSLAVLGWFVPISGLTCVYCGYNGNWFYGASLSMIVLAVTYLFAVAAASLQRGQTRESILTAGLVAEIVFLAVYIGFSLSIYAL